MNSQTWKKIIHGRYLLVLCPPFEVICEIEGWGLSLHFLHNLYVNQNKRWPFTVTEEMIYMLKLL